MILIFRSVLFCALLFSMISCKVKQQANEAQNVTQIAIKQLGQAIDSFPNSSGKFILYVQKADPNHPTYVIKAIVIETASNKVVMEDSFVPGYIKWISEGSLELLSIPGTIKADQTLSDYKRIIAIKTTKSDL